MVGVLARLWGALKSKHLAGVDKAGNSYYRQPKRVDGALTERRWVEFKGDPDPTTIPVEWTSWLSGRRKEALTPEECAALEAYRKQVKMKAEIIAKEEEKRRFRSKIIQQDAGGEELKPADMDKFVQQVARLEGISFSGGDGSFSEGIAKKTMTIEGTARLMNDDLADEEKPKQDQQGPMDQGLLGEEKPKQDQQRGQLKESSVYEKWVPPE